MTRNSRRASGNGSPNEEEIRRVSGKRARSLGFFYFWIAWMPLTLFGCCGLGLASGSGNLAVGGFMAGILLPFVGLGGLLLMGNDRLRYSRSYALASEADELGLRFRETPTRKQYGFLNDFQLLSDPTNEAARDWISGDYRGRRMTAVDYSCAWGRGKFARVIGMTVLVVDPVERVPNFILSPRGLFDRLTEAVGLTGKPLPVPGEKEFSRSYGLFGRQGREAAGRFGRELIDLCMEEGDLVIEVRDGVMLLYHSDKRIKPAELEEFLRLGGKVARLLEG